LGQWSKLARVGESIVEVNEQPLVSVVTPVYNGERYLAECIESVLRQTYRNFEYIIVDNCSTDGTAAIIERYARTDRRIRVYRNEELLDVISNHNKAFRLISHDAKYCKVVSGDDWIFPECIDSMVCLAEDSPSVSIIGAYQLSGQRILWQGFEYPKAVFTGREICRRIFLGAEQTFGFGSPTSLLYRADIVRGSDAFYPNLSPHSDTSACFEHLRDSSFGFVYKVLSFERTHEATQSTKSIVMNRYSSAYLNDVIQYGPSYLNSEEFKQVLDRQLNGYHRFLAAAYLKRSGDREFWNYHRSRLAELGHPLTRFTLMKAGLSTIVREVLNPKQAVAKLRKRASPNRQTCAQSSATHSSR
jgi:glycosyltransferase involved in cell wall biosynthesis